jgi:sugar phosphate permease
MVYWVQTLIYFCGTCGLLLLNVNYKNYISNKLSNDELLTIMGVVSSIGSGLSRFVWSLIFNCTGYKFVALTNLLIQAVIFITLKFSVNVPGVYFLLIFLANCCFGGFAVITPTFSQLVFGT